MYQCYLKIRRLTDITMIIMYVYTIQATNIYLVNTYIPQFLLLKVHVVKAQSLVTGSLSFLGEICNGRKLGQYHSLNFGGTLDFREDTSNHCMSILTVFNVAVNHFEVHKLYTFLSTREAYICSSLRGDPTHPNSSRCLLLSLTHIAHE